ncbi:DUF4190 domain-containing protein [Leucobacter allii]|uniref:DUF4190 domain-containing protein n=1 Tax=Leucobacter allii TaxID=2932247 RepID=A0ABY4FNY0_9MICO|nr:DUF4190 domain-containing protein [Leucobacter allii]UOQ57995.1 DUF4190 domain-containing protein [Leucobacter allii]UOR02629.1 DUF4190 domain-containing protein [Leucobacter allii]
MSTPTFPQQPEDQANTQAQPTTPYPATQLPGGAPYGAPAAPSQPAPAYVAQPQPRPAVPASTDTTLAGTNTFALLAIILAFLAPLAGIIFGHLGLSQIKRNGDAGRGIALTGLIISYAYFVLVALLVIAYIGLIFAMFAGIGALAEGFGSYDYSDDYGSY